MKVGLLENGIVLLLVRLKILPVAFFMEKSMSSQLPRRVASTEQCGGSLYTFIHPIPESVYLLLQALNINNMFLQGEEVNRLFHTQDCVLKVCVVSALLLISQLQFFSMLLFYCSYFPVQDNFFFFQITVFSAKNAVGLMALRPVPPVKITEVSAVQAPHCSGSSSSSYPFQVYQGISNMIWRKLLEDNKTSMWSPWSCSFSSLYKTLNRDIS